MDGEFEKTHWANCKLTMYLIQATRDDTAVMLSASDINVSATILQTFLPSVTERDISRFLSTKLLGLKSREP